MAHFAPHHWPFSNLDRYCLPCPVIRSWSNRRHPLNGFLPFVMRRFGLWSNWSWVFFLLFQRYSLITVRSQWQSTKAARFSALFCSIYLIVSGLLSGVEGYPRSYRNLSENVKIEQTNKTQSRLRYQISKGDIAIITRATNLQLIIENELSSEATSSNQGFLTIF
jgi:hypothetical protein